MSEWRKHWQVGKAGGGAGEGGWLMTLHLPSESRTGKAGGYLAPSLHLNSPGSQPGKEATQSGRGFPPQLAYSR